MPAQPTSPSTRNTVKSEGFLTIAITAMARMRKGKVVRASIPAWVSSVEEARIAVLVAEIMRESSLVKAKREDMLCRSEGRKKRRSSIRSWAACRASKAGNELGEAP